MYFHHRSCCYYSKRGDGCWTSPMPFIGDFGNCPPLPSLSCSPAPSRADQPDTAPFTGFSRLAGKLRPFAYIVLCRGHWFVRAGGWFSFYFFALLFFVLSVCVAFFDLFSVVVCWSIGSFPSFAVICRLTSCWTFCAYTFFVLLPWYIAPFLSFPKKSGN